MPNKKIVLKVTDIHKSFASSSGNANSLKSTFVNIFRRREKSRTNILKGVSFEVKKGEFFGIVGRNGGGKSTLLKLIAGIYSPDSGNIFIDGRLTPFIELGVGFNPDLTGRENVYLNGALMGLDTDEVDEIYEKIVAFAELEDYMDEKLRNYSSGMQVRLAFSVAIQANSEILLIDEVLAVGDSNFQKKCFDVFEKFKEDGRTVVFISHSMPMVTKFCDRAVLLSKGEIIAEGEPEVVAAEYELLNNEEQMKNSDRLQIKNPREAHIVEAVLDNFEKEQPLLEIGSGTGRNIELLSSMHRQVMGLDKNVTKKANKIVKKELGEVRNLSQVQGLLVLDNLKSISKKYLTKIFSELGSGKLKTVEKIYLHLPFYKYQKLHNHSHLGNPLNIMDLTKTLEEQGFTLRDYGLYGVSEDDQYAEAIFERITGDVAKQRWQ